MKKFFAVLILLIISLWVLNTISGAPTWDMILFYAMLSPFYAAPILFSIITVSLLRRKQKRATGIIALVYSILVITLFISAGSIDGDGWVLMGLYLYNIVAGAIGIPLLIVAGIIERMVRSERIKNRYIALTIMLILAVPIVWFLTQHVVREYPRYEALKAMSGKWESTLSKHLANADKLEIIDPPDTLLLSLTDKCEIQRLIDMIAVNETELDETCFCAGSPWLVFKEGTNELAILSYHHNERLRWKEGLWPEDAVLISYSNHQFNQWLSDMQIHGANQRLEPIVKTSADKVEAQGTQAHP